LKQNKLNEIFPIVIKKNIFNMARAYQMARQSRGSYVPYKSPRPIIDWRATLEQRRLKKLEKMKQYKIRAKR
jgi:hypothetical protein